MRVAVASQTSLGFGGLGLDGGGDRLDGNAAAGDELAPGTSGGRAERRRPGVLPDDDTGNRAGLHGSREMGHVLLGQDLRHLGLESS